VSQLGAISSLRGHLAMSGSIFGCHSWKEGFSNIPAEACNPAKHPAMHRTAPPTKKYLGQNVNGAKVETGQLKIASTDIVFTLCQTLCYMYHSVCIFLSSSI